MGFFNKSKKEKEIAKVVKNAGYEMNDADLSRRSSKQEAKRIIDSSVKKENILDKLTSLKTSLKYYEAFDLQVDRLGDLIRKLDRMDDETTDRVSLASVDAFILAAVKTANQLCNYLDNNALDAWLDFIEGFIDDRMRSAPYYSNEKYVAAQFERIRLFGEVKKAESEKRRLEKEVERLKARYAVASTRSDKTAIAKRLADNQEERRLLTVDIDKYDLVLKKVEADVKDFKNKDAVYNEGRYNHVEVSSETNEAKNTFDETVSIAGKLRKQSLADNRKVSSSAMALNDDIMDNDINIDLKDEDFV